MIDLAAYPQIPIDGQLSVEPGPVVRWRPDSRSEWREAMR